MNRRASWENILSRGFWACLQLFCYLSTFYRFAGICIDQEGQVNLPFFTSKYEVPIGGCSEAQPTTH
jgi:hypothetical protein